MGQPPKVKSEDYPQSWPTFGCQATSFSPPSFSGTQSQPVPLLPKKQTFSIILFPSHSPLHILTFYSLSVCLNINSIPIYIDIHLLASLAPPDMPSFLSLPPEIRFQIYRELRSFKSPLIKSPSQDDSNPLGYCSFGFCSRILETSRQISYEAREVFYGENYWTFFASQRNHFSSLLFQMEPMVLVLPFIRKAHIRFGMFHWLYWESCGLKGCTYGDITRTNVEEICHVLHTAPTLRTVKIIWTETCTTWPMRQMTQDSDSVRSLISELLWPLIYLPAMCDLQKSNIMVAYRNGEKARRMELDFSECVDEVIALHRSRKES